MTIKTQRGGRTQPNLPRVNGAIRAHEVRVIGSDGEALGVFSSQEALKIAQEESLDLVEISPTANPPVCKIIDFGKYLYEKSKVEKENKKKQKQIHVKEIKFRPHTDDNDYQVKLRSLLRFLNEGNKAKVTLRFRGREMAHKELGLALLNRVKDDLADISTVESFPKLEGRQAVMMLSPKKKAN